MIPKRAMSPLLKGECYRFYSALLLMASKYGNPFNYTDRSLSNDFGFHISRISSYKSKLEELGLVSIALMKTPELRWPKTYYFLLEFWNYDSLSSL